MITTSDEAWATNTLRDAQDPGAGKQSWAALTRITLERYNLIFSQVDSRGYASEGLPQHDAATCLENGKAILVKVALAGNNDLVFSKWSVSGLEYNNVKIVTNADLSDTARLSIEAVYIPVPGTAFIRVFYVDENDDEVCYIDSLNGGGAWEAEASVGALANLKAIASVSPTKVHCVTYASGNSRFHYFEYSGEVWNQTDSLIYWPHKIEHIDAITIGDRDLVVFYSEGPKYGEYLEAGIYGIWVEHGRWSDIFKIDVLDEADDYAYRQHPMISTANGIYFLTGYLSEGDEDYSHTTRFLKTSKDGQNWSQYMPLVTCPEAGPAKLLVINTPGGSWPWDAGQQVYLIGYDKVYESDATRLVGEINTALQVDVQSRTRGWQLQRGVISQANTILSNHDGGLDAHAIINADNTLLLKREAGYHTGEGDEYAQVTLEAVDFIKETDELPQRHKQVASRDFMAWVRDKEADHFECWESQLVGYDNYDDDTETGYGGLGHTATQKGWWETENNVLWLRSNNEMGLAFATWDSKIMNGQVKAMIRVETSGNNEYAGVVFRAKDEGNFWTVYYNQATNKIVLRQRSGGSWLPIVAQSSASLGWSIDTWYGLMVDFRYGYIRVFRSIDGATWTQDFTYVITPNDLNPSPEYGYTGLIGYGYSSEDEEEAPGYTPPTPPQAPPAAGSGHLLYFTGFQCGGRLFRSRNARDAATSVVYENCGVINSGGIYHFALDPWDPKNKAVAAGPNGVWKTSNLDSATPTWTQVVDLSATADYYAWHVAFSICQEGLCAVGGAKKIGADWWSWLWYTKDNWATFTEVNLAEGDSGDAAKVEWSSHNPQKGWACWGGGAPGPVVSRTTNQWTAHTDYQLTCLGGGAGEPMANPHHRYLDNADDLYALYGHKQGGTDVARLSWNTNDVSACTGVNLTGTNARPHWLGSYTWGTGQYWCLYSSNEGWRFAISNNGLTWVLRYTFTGTTRNISGWPYEGARFYACQDGTTAPILISDDEGESWRAQTGNWNALCTSLSIDPDIYVCVPVWTE